MLIENLRKIILNQSGVQPQRHFVWWDLESNRIRAKMGILSVDIHRYFSSYWKWDWNFHKLPTATNIKIMMSCRFNRINQCEMEMMWDWFPCPLLPWAMKSLVRVWIFLRQFPLNFLCCFLHDNVRNSQSHLQSIVGDSTNNFFKPPNIKKK